ncbi:MAG: hypothetical protein QNJ63_28785 [Calothrix sp. MO_192.B10]|nr:hypothetical protein [Calothrix sp. MO_192.B10]
MWRYHGCKVAFSDIESYYGNNGICDHQAIAGKLFWCEQWQNGIFQKVGL